MVLLAVGCIFTQLFGALSRQAKADLMRDIMKDVLTFVSDV